MSPNWPRRVAVLDAKQDSPNIDLNMKMDFIGLGKFFKDRVKYR